MTRKKFTTDTRLFVPNNPTSPRLCPELAVEIGLNESILLLQLEFWIVTMGMERDGNWWVYRSLADLRDTFPFWGRSTIWRALQELVKKGLIAIGNYNQAGYDRTGWYSLNLDACRKLNSLQVALLEETAQNDTGEVDELSQTETAPKAGVFQNETATPPVVPKWNNDTRDRERERDKRIEDGEKNDSIPGKRQQWLGDHQMREEFKAYLTQVSDYNPVLLERLGQLQLVGREDGHWTVRHNPLLIDWMQGRVPQIYERLCERVRFVV